MTRPPSKIRQKIAGTRRYSLHELAMVPAALILLGAARLAILLIPFRRYRKVMGAEAPVASGAVPIGEKQRSHARSIGRTVRASASVTPWASVCLPQALAANVLLRLHGVPSVTYFGLAPGQAVQSNDPMRAHAWVMAGDLVVTGGPVDPDYRSVAAFRLGSDT